MSPTMLTLLAATLAAAGEHTAMPLTESLAPYTGPVVKEVDTSTFLGKVMCGYQGWFMARGDGFTPGFVHWGGVDGNPPRATVDFWPDLTEVPAEERFASNFRYPDGSRAELFSSTVKPTVLRHFKWMRDYGIDGVWVQRFAGCVGNQRDWNYQRTCAVLSHCREGANTYGRAFGVMYDTSFDRKSVDIVKADWTRLMREMRVTDTPAYIRHRGAPVVSLWGFGFGHYKWDDDAAEELLRFFKQPENGACTLMLGVPNDWASWTDKRMALLKQYGTIISPWNVGRFGTVEGAQAHGKRFFPGDLAFCRANDKDYYVVAFPGFSWTNLMKGQSPLNQTPRQGGRFFWSQFEQIKQYGLNAAYVAMFDEVDEGTAIFKCTNNPPVGRFCTYEGLPSDHYLKLTGLGRRLLLGEAVTFPEVQPDPAQLGYRPVSQLAFYKQASTLDPALRARWRQAWQGQAFTVHGEPYSGWLTDLYNSDSLELRLSNWADILKQPLETGVAVVAPGNEGFGGPESLAPQVAQRLAAQLKAGGTVLVLAGAGYPCFYPGGGTEAAKFGLRLAMTNAPEGSRVTFVDGLKPYVLPKRGASRLMRPALYPGAQSYRALATVTTPDGATVGDAAAVVQLGAGRLVYVASDLLGYPDRGALLDLLLSAARR